MEDHDLADSCDEFSLPGSQTQGMETCDPFAADPVFSSEEEMRKCLQDMGHKDIFLTSFGEEIDASDERKASCDCGNCCGLMIRKGYKDHIRRTLIYEFLKTLSFSLIFLRIC